MRNYTDLLISACILYGSSALYDVTGVNGTPHRLHGATENAGLENAGQENGGPNGRGGKRGTGKRGTGKHGNIVCMGSDT